MMIKACDICKKPLNKEGEVAVDGRIRLVGRTPWAYMCRKCFDHSGVGLGTSVGQMYQLTKGRWKKIGG